MLSPTWAIGDERLNNPCEQKPTRVLAGGSVRGVLTHAVVAFACAVQVLPVDGASTPGCLKCPTAIYHA
jgi:hypothetical protein